MPKIIPQNDSNFLATRSEKDSYWDLKKEENQVLENIYRILTPEEHGEFYARFKKYPDRLYGCSDYLAFALRANLETGLEVLKLANAQFCRIRHCPICQVRLSMKWVAKFHQIMPALLKDHENTQFILLTLTVKNCEIDDLRTTIQKMNHAWQKLIRRKFFTEKILGYIRSTEVTKNHETKEAHPHFHVLLHVPNSYFNGRNYIKKTDWLTYWQEAMQDPTIKIVDVRKVREHKNKTKEENLIKGALEVVKYATKQSNIADEPEWFFKFCVQVDKLRFMATGGTLKDLIADLEKDDLVHIDEEGTEENQLSDDLGLRLMFKWDRQKNYRRDPKRDYVAEKDS